ncbi:MAG: helix-turn-helix domain-containing protein [Actinomycetota bacterium]|nr:helix-turn-helix domain-containing protein [Actinomycetota bacterium]
MGVDAERVLEAAIESLGTLRGLTWLGDAGVALHLLASLVAEAELQMPRAVADARDQEYSWAQIGDLLGVTRASAWQRYGGRGAKDRTPPTLD